MSGHTPTPWEQSDVEWRRIQCEGRGEEIAHVLSTEKPIAEQEANAFFIVRAVNAWDDPAALRARLKELEGSDA